MRSGQSIKENELCFTLMCSRCKGKVIFPMSTKPEEAKKKLRDKYNWTEEKEGSMKRLLCEYCSGLAVDEFKGKKKSKNKNKKKDKEESDTAPKQGDAEDKKTEKKATPVKEEPEGKVEVVFVDKKPSKQRSLNDLKKLKLGE